MNRLWSWLRRDGPTATLELPSTLKEFCFLNDAAIVGSTALWFYMQSVGNTPTWMPNGVDVALEVVSEQNDIQELCNAVAGATVLEVFVAEDSLKKKPELMTLVATEETSLLEMLPEEYVLKKEASAAMDNYEAYLAFKQLVQQQTDDTSLALQDVFSNDDKRVISEHVRYVMTIRDPNLDIPVIFIGVDCLDALDSITDQPASVRMVIRDHEWCFEVSPRTAWVVAHLTADKQESTPERIQKYTERGFSFV